MNDENKIKLGYCTECNKKLLPIGKKKDGSTKFEDWETRKMHKKCYKEYITIQNFLRMMVQKT